MDFLNLLSQFNLTKEEVESYSFMLTINETNYVGCWVDKEKFEFVYFKPNLRNKTYLLGKSEWQFIFEKLTTKQKIYLVANGFDFDEEIIETKIPLDYFCVSMFEYTFEYMKNFLHDFLNKVVVEKRNKIINAIEY